MGGLESDNLKLIDIGNEDDSLLLPAQNQEAILWNYFHESVSPSKREKVIPSEHVIVTKPTPEEQFSKLSEVLQLTEDEKLNQFNVRKSLAWNEAFFINEGLLNDDELSLLGATSNIKNKHMPTIKEDHDKILKDHQTPKPSTLRVRQTSPNLQGAAKLNRKHSSDVKNPKYASGGRVLYSSNKSERNKVSSRVQWTNKSKDASAKTSCSGVKSSSTMKKPVEPGKRLRVLHDFSPAANKKLANPTTNRPKNGNIRENEKVTNNIRSSNAFNSTLPGIPVPSSLTFAPGTGFSPKQAPHTALRVTRISNLSQPPGRIIKGSRINISKRSTEQGCGAFESKIPKMKFVISLDPNIPQHGGFVFDSKKPPKAPEASNNSKCHDLAVTMNDPKNGIFVFGQQKPCEADNAKQSQEGAEHGTKDPVNAAAMARPPPVRYGRMNPKSFSMDEEKYKNLVTQPSQLKLPSVSFKFFDTGMLPSLLCPVSIYPKETLRRMLHSSSCTDQSSLHKSYSIPACNQQNCKTTPCPKLSSSDLESRHPFSYETNSLMSSNDMICGNSKKNKVFRPEDTEYQHRWESSDSSVNPQHLPGLKEEIAKFAY